MKLSAGKEDPVEFDSSLTLCSDMRGVVIGGRLPTMKYHYSYRRFTYPMVGERQPPALRVRVLRTRGFSDSSDKHASACDPSFGDTSQVGSLAGAAHLLHINAGVLRQAQ